MAIAPSPENVVREMQTQGIPSHATRQLAAASAPVPAKSERLRDVSSGQYVKAPMVRPNWSTLTQEIGLPGEAVVAGIGVGVSLVNKMSGMPGASRKTMPPCSVQ